MKSIETLERVETVSVPAELQTWISEEPYNKSRLRCESVTERQEIVHDIFIMNKDA